MLIRDYAFDKFSIQVHDTIFSTELKADWDKLSVSGFPLNPDYLGALERAEPKDLSFRYLLIRDGNEIVARIYFQILHFGRQNLSVDGNSIGQKFAALAVRLIPFKIIVAGNLFAVDSCPLYYLPEKISAGHILHILDEYTKAEKFDVFVLKDFPVEFTPELTRPYGLNTFESDMTMELTLHPSWSAFQDYEKSLTHKYAQRARKIRKSGSVIERRVLDDGQLEEHKNRIAELFREICSKQTLRMGIIDEKYFLALNTCCKDRFRITGYFLENKMIAFSTTLAQKETLEVHYIGIDYSYNKSHSLYFNILFDGVEQAILQGYKKLELGRTAREAKAVVGCQPVYFNDYMLIRNRITRRIISVIQDYFQKKMGDSWKERHPFKTHQA
ncbi:MAG TPA: GNAT family N-acetyltransferase [Bacteroidia bacterium]|nr:GNAT family N-acetyltransferase [Bacteroidia bacterium]